MEKSKYIFPLVLFIILFLFASCTGIPEGVEPVKNFQPKKYMGKWYEIARLDHSFERGLQKVYAKYSLKNEDTVKILNKGYNPKEKEWNSVSGTGYFAKNKNIGALKITFFWPFYAGYNIIYLDKNYQNTIVCGSSKSYLWILSREKDISPEKQEFLINKAKKLGFDVSELIFPEH